MDGCSLWVLCVLSGRGLCDGLITRPDLINIAWTRMNVVFSGILINSYLIIPFGRKLPSKLFRSTLQI
jgi:hypothetical protein